MSDTLPPSWRRVKLGDVIDYGKAERAEPADIPSGAWVLELEDIEKDSSRLLQRLTLDQRQSKSTKNRFRRGDVLYGKLRPYLNKVLIADQDGYCTTEILPLSPNEIVDGRYLFYWLKHPEFLDYVTAVSHGLNMPRLGTEAGKQAPFVLAPLAEQQRIADKLDALLARVDACRARLGRASAVIKRFRQAVLAAAVSGRLTEDWREENPELISSDQLIDRLSQRISKNGQSQLRLSDDERFTATELRPGWQFVPVGLVGDVYLGRQRSPENHNGPYMRPYVRAANITWQGWDLSDVKQMNFDPKDFVRYKLQVGDVLINEGSGSADEVGKPAIWKGDIENCCFQNTLICVRPHEEMSDYLYFVFLHAAMSKAFVEDTRGVNIYHIGKERFSAYLIPLPSLAEQHEIVRRVETLFAYADRLDARLAAAQARVAQLTPSLLAKAFRGEMQTAD